MFETTTQSVPCENTMENMCLFQLPRRTKRCATCRANSSSTPLVRSLMAGAVYRDKDLVPETTLL